MAAAMSGWGSYELSRRLSLSLRDREIVIDRTCARCRCEPCMTPPVSARTYGTGWPGYSATSSCLT
jgi:hypothetical protein